MFGVVQEHRSAEERKEKHCHVSSVDVVRERSQYEGSMGKSTRVKRMLAAITEASTVTLEVERPQ